MRHASAAEPKLPYKPLRHTQHGVTPYPIVNMGMEDLLRKRTHLKGVLENHWFPCHIPIPVEEDGRYNNPMYWSRNRTETHEKKNEGKALKNMLCHNRVMGKAYLDHPGKCTPTLMRDEPICREDYWENMSKIPQWPKPTYISNITSHWDSASSRGVQEAMGVHAQTMEALRDTYHLAQS